MRQIVKTANAPAAIGPYSQAVGIEKTGLVFCSGQIALDPKSGEVVGESAADQCRQVLTNLAAVLEAAGSSLDQVVKTTLYLVSIDDFAAVNEAYGEFFKSEPPARAAVAVRDLPKGARIMVDAIAAA